MFLLSPDGCGGQGGIALYNRMLLAALQTRTPAFKITVIPRFAVKDTGASEIEQDLRGVGSKFKYAMNICRLALGGRKVDLLICGHIHLLPLAVFLALVKRAPLILIIYGIDAWGRSSLPIRTLLRRVNCIISISEFTSQRFVARTKTPREKIRILPNSFDASAFAPGPKPTYLMDRYSLHGREVLLTLGRLESRERYKGFDEVLEVLSALSTLVPNVCYLIAGTGNDRPRLEKKAQELGIRDRVVFTGYVEEAEKPDLYRVADAYVMPSKGEGFGFVLLEALASGLPVVGSRLDGGREALRDGMLGILVNPDDQDEVIDAILRALKQRGRQVPAGLQHFSFDRFVSQVDKIVLDVVHHNQPLLKIAHAARHVSLQR